MTDREFFIAVNPEVRIRCRRTVPPAAFEYAVTLELLEGRGWTTNRLWDNADDPNTHHEHPHTPSAGKHLPSSVAHGDPRQAMAAAVAKARRDWPAIVRRWKEQS